MMGGWGMFRRMRGSDRVLIDLVEALMAALDDAVGRIGASADKIIAALQGAGAGGADEQAAADALNATADRMDAATAVASGTGTSSTPPADGGTPPPPDGVPGAQTTPVQGQVQPIAGGTPEQPAG